MMAIYLRRMLNPIDNEDDVLLDDECVMDEDYDDVDKVFQLY